MTMQLERSDTSLSEETYLDKRFLNRHSAQKLGA